MSWEMHILYFDNILRDCWGRFSMASTWGTVLYKWFTSVKENVNFCVPPFQTTMFNGSMKVDSEWLAYGEWRFSMASTWRTVLTKWFTLMNLNVNFCVPLFWTTYLG